MIKHFLVALVVVMMAQQVTAQVRSEKRGLAYGQHSKKDLQSLAPGVSWWYNWYHQPEAGVINDYKSLNVDYVTMAWNGAFDKAAMRKFLQTHPDVKYILGWNEPNFIDQARMTPSEAAARWVDIQAIADEFGLKIGSPAVNYCGNCVSENGTTYTDPVKYLDDFFAACKTCRVDFIAIHCYMSHVSALQWYVSLFEKYNKPIWLTEFASWEGSPTLAEQKSFMVGAVDYLENNSNVFRYAWFTGRSTGVPYNALLTDPGVLTDLGKIYVNMPVHSTTSYVTVPARIQAEAYTTMKGIALEATQDDSGIVHVTSLDAGDWLDYNLDVKTADTYPLKLRVASRQSGSIKIMEGNQTLLSLSIPDGKDITKWQTVTSSLKLAVGKHTLRVQVVTAGFNINWFEIGNVPVSNQPKPGEDKDPDLVVGNEPEPVLADAAYPNPVDETLFIPNFRTVRSLEIINVYGATVYSGPASAQMDLTQYEPGLYIMKLTSFKGSVSTRKIIKK